MISFSRYRFFGIVSLSLAMGGCSSLLERPQKTSSIKKDPASYVAEGIHDGNRAPASMSPPLDVSPDQIQLDPMYMRTKADYHFTIGEAYAYEGNSTKAIEEFKLTSVYDPNSATVRLKLAVEYIKKGMLSEALVQCEEAVKLNSDYFEARILLGGIYSSLKLYTKAEAEYKHVIKIHPEKHEGSMYLGALYAEQKKYNEAIEVFKGLLKDSEYENPHMAHYYIGRIQLEKGETSAAEKSFSKALESKPSHVESVMALGLLHESLERRLDAKKLYSSYQDKFGPSEKVAEPLSRLHLEDEEYDLAYRQLEIVLASDPDDLGTRVKLALILIEQKTYPKAIKQLKEILALAPDSDKIRFFLGAVYEEVKDYTAAIEQFMVIGPTSSYYPEAMVHASYLHKVQRDYPKAIETIESAIKMRPDHVQFYALYASYLDDTKQYDKAVKMLTDATAKFPSSEQMHFFLGSMQDKVGNREGTVRSMKQVIQLNSEHVQALNYLAYTYAEMGIELDVAYEHAKKAVRLKPQDAYIQDTLGWVLFKSGKLHEAARVLEAAHKLKSDESIIAEHLGDVYFQLKLPAKAKDMYIKAVSHEKDSANAQKIRTKIATIDSAESVTQNTRVPSSSSIAD